ncbi:WD repeat-containing and planar cell polarity effector protein fritz homolog [Tachypleus tridentatus]|uniref:WD repeat-containing and planar cell polarity effector protein fritz homolog n=1 Tax=Tachypleus tridentatus TaxID=6853 RepID=UPI003FD5715C
MAVVVADRDVVCIPRNKRPEKLKDTLKELEELLETDKCTTLKWIDAALFQLFLSSGILVTIFLSDNCNIKKVQIDRHLVGKLVSDHIVEVVIEDSHLLVSYVEPKLSYIYFGKQQASTSDRKYEKLGAMDPKIVTFDLIGPTSRHIERRLSSNSLHDAVLVWWHTDTQEAWPWSSLTSDRDRANILVYALNGPSLELMCFSHIDKSLLHACFRQHQSNYILTVEEETRRSKEVMVNVCTYEVSRTRFHQASVTSIPLEEHVLSAQWSPSEDKLLLSCSDRSLVIYDAYRHLTRITTLNFAVQQISWHPSGTLALVAGELGQLQCFDAALSCVNLEFVGEEAESSKVIEMSNFFRQKINLTFLAWQSWSGVEASKPTKSAITAVVALFEKGPLTIIKFPLGVLNVGKLTPFELITQYLKCKQVDEAVCLLLSLDWNRQGELCLKCLNCICNWLLRKPLNQDREVQLEAALGSFYGPNEPLSEVIILEYRDQVGHLARRFFHHLLRSALSVNCKYSESPREGKTLLILSLLKVVKIQCAVL